MKLPFYKNTFLILCIFFSKDSSSILASSTFGTSTEPATSGMRIHERDLSQHAQASSSGSLSSLQRGVSSHQIYIQQPSNMNNVLHQSSHDQLAGATALSQPPTKVRSVSIGSSHTLNIAVLPDFRLEMNTIVLAIPEKNIILIILVQILWKRYRQIKILSAFRFQNWNFEWMLLKDWVHASTSFTKPYFSMNHI